MVASPQFESYLNWLRERGLRYPALRPAPVVSEREMPQTPSAVEATAAPALAAAAVAPSLLGYGSDRPRVVFVAHLAFADGSAERDLLDRMIVAMKLGAEGTYVSGRAPNDPDFTAGLAALDPQIIVLLGEAAARAAFGAQVDFAAIRGKFAPAALCGGRLAIATHHPADLLRQPALKRTAWDDLKLVMSRLEIS